MIRRAIALCAAGVATLSLGIGGATAANAASPATPTVVTAASSRTATTPDPTCVAARQKTKAPGACAASVTTARTAGRPITAAELAQYGALKAGNGLTVSQAAAAGTVWIAGWSQTAHGLYYVNWTEKHEGKWLYNGSIAWVNDHYGYTGGYHHCGLGYGILYSVSVVYCNEYGEGTSRVDNKDQYQVHVVARGIPIYATHTLDAYTYGSGALA